MYPLIRRILFKLDPELAHSLALKWLKLSTYFSTPHKNASRPVKVAGLTFPNSIGLAAGFDKNGHYIDALACLGFGFIEIGTVTLQSQKGNPRPRIFRLTQNKAIINRLGFNNNGCDSLIEQLQKIKFQSVLGINIGKGYATDLSDAHHEYIQLFKKVHPYADYVTINISSPNTKSLRELQHGDLLTGLLRELKKTQVALTQQSNKYVPLFVKISPDLTLNELKQMTAIFLQEKMDGVIATNTTLNRDNIIHPHAKESGGLSGKPLRTRSTLIIKQLHELLEDNIPIIASGGILTLEDAQEKLSAGAKLIQVYTGLIYSGPALVKKLTRNIGNTHETLSKKIY